MKGLSVMASQISNDPAFMPISALSQAIQSGALSPVDLMARFLARIGAYDEKLHAFVCFYEDDARMAAEAADKAIRAGHSVGPLHGIPIAIKDIVDMEGRVTTGGSKVWIDRVSPVTATLVERLIAAGMIVIGKTHSVEFAMGGWGTNQHMGTPWNPWDLATHRTPGGSSAGSGVSVAAGLAPCAIGTDTGGSVRLPASWCGLTGLKTTIGRVSVHGVLPLSNTLDTPGPMTRTVEDAALLYNVLAGPDPKDPLTLRHPVTDPLPEMRKGVAGLRLAVMPETERNGVDPEMLAAYDDSIETLRELGAQITTLALPYPFRKLGAATGQIIGAEGYFFVGDVVDQMDLPVDDAVRPRIWIGKDMSARDYQRALKAQQDIKASFDDALVDVDALLTPTTATPAIPVDAVDQNDTPAMFTRVANLLERCALSLPNGFTAGGLPTSLQIVCRGYDEAMALRIGWAYEQATNWTGRAPMGLED
ncbi:MAG: aspartyl-tRNA(Asn)/glutamyl-tRNA(Gln) amidotransferase subunit A [Alphaproteobacteria bacterium]